MHIKNRNNQNGPKNRTSMCSLRKFMLVCAFFYKLEVPLIPSHHAAEIFEKVVTLY
jgi:hypothetical protein